MNILIYSPSFYPVIGGLETINYLIAQGLSKHYSVVVITPILDMDTTHDYSFKIVRTRSLLVLWKEYLCCDIFVHSVLSLKAVFPLLILPKPWVCIHHTCYFRIWDKHHTISSCLKHLFSKFCHNICVSDAVGRSLSLNDYTVIHNSYDNEIFKKTNSGLRSGFVFVGRLVTEKGIDILINAYNEYLQYSSKKEPLYIIGDGPLMNYSYQLAHSKGVDKKIIFLGIKKGKELSEELNKRKCMIVPSVYREAFGIVVLEGLATGCQVIGSDGDGIKEAIGSCGKLFKKGDVHDLSQKMLEEDKETIVNEQEITNHLNKFTPLSLEKQYSSYFYKWRNRIKTK